MLYPLKFTPILKQTLWGGTALTRRLNKPEQGGPAGESWELCCRPDGMSRVSNGPHRGAPLDQLIRHYKGELLGSFAWETFGGEFPLLFKFIDAAERLSVQVHPDDAMARELGEPFGKEELWFVAEAPERGRLVVGLQSGATERDCRFAMERGRLPELLREVPVGAGEFVHIPPGTVHAILEGFLLAEIQQNSNTTFRLYDWGRLGPDGSARPLHVEQALRAIKFDARPASPFRGENYRREGLSVSAGPSVGPFRVDHERLEGRCRCAANPRAFSVLMVLEGGGELVCSTGSTLIRQGDTVMIPATLGLYRMEGMLSCLRTHLDT